MTPTGGGNSNWIEVNMLAEIKKEITGLAVTRKALRDFGLLFCVVFALAAGVMYWKGNPGWKWSVAGSAGFLLAGLLVPTALSRFFRLWMGLAFVMGWVMTRVVLTAAFSLIMTPLGIVLRAMGKDLLDKKLQKGSATYWKSHAAVNDREQYKKQF